MITRFISKINSFFKSYYQLDLRSIALMRIALALVVIADLSIRFGDLSAFYTNSGMWSTDLIQHSGWKTGYWSLHALSGEKPLQVFLFLLHFLFAISFLLGFYSRTSAFLLYVLYISLHNRNIFILQAGDDLLRLTLLVCVLLPIGTYYALDARNRKPISLVRTAHLLYLLLIASVYGFTLVLKSGPDWRVDFSAVNFALQLRQLRLPVGDFLLQFPALHAPLTILVLMLELLIVLFIIWPSKSGKTRLLAFFALLLLQIGIGITMYVGLFFIISIASAIALLPASVMDRLELFFLPKKEVQLTEKSESARNGIAVVLIALFISINLSTIKSFEYEPGTPIAEVIHAARLDQNWAMFSPGVLRKDGWLVLFGRDALGRQIDIRKNEDYVDFSEPKSVVAMYKNDRWRKWAENMQDERFTFLRPPFCEYILKNFNQHSKKRRATTLHVYFMQVDNDVDSTKTNPKRSLYCFCHDL
jgi:hypothetical protein